MEKLNITQIFNLDNDISHIDLNDDDIDSIDLNENINGLNLNNYIDLDELYDTRQQSRLYSIILLIIIIFNVVILSIIFSRNCFANNIMIYSNRNSSMITEQLKYELTNVYTVNINYNISLDEFFKMKRTNQLNNNIKEDCELAKTDYLFFVYYKHTIFYPYMSTCYIQIYDTQTFKCIYDKQSIFDFPTSDDTVCIYKHIDYHMNNIKHIIMPDTFKVVLIKNNEVYIKTNRRLSIGTKIKYNNMYYTTVLRMYNDNIAVIKNNKFISENTIFSLY